MEGEYVIGDEHAPEPAAPRTGTGVSRRGLLGVFGAALISAGCTADVGGDHEEGSGPRGVLGANFNEDPAGIRPSELRAFSASWLRGFIPMPDVDKGDPANQAAVATLRKVADQGYGTILTLKFPYNHRPIPRADSPAMAAELARLDKVLQAVMGKANILVIGNEPFIESLPADRNSASINAFYEKVAQRVIEYRRKHFGARCRTRLYMGALNHLDDPRRRTASTERWMTFARETTEIEGVDIHPHVVSIEAGRKYLDYVLPRLRGDQRFLATEFSLMPYWRQHMRDRIPAEFARRFGMDPSTPVWELIRNSIQSPLPQAGWNQFLAMSPWFESRKHYLRNQVQAFRGTGRLAVATYGVLQGQAMVRDFGPGKPPWLLNSLYASRTVQPGTDGSHGRSYSWFDDFRALQRKGDRLPVRTGETAT